MWMLVTTLCLQLDAKTADCRVEYRGPYPKQSDCREMMQPTGDALTAIADDLKARVLFAYVGCTQGRDI